MKTIEEKLEYLFSVNPKLSENNTETCVALHEYVAVARGLDINNEFWLEMKSIIRTYPPESITRARRAMTKSTEAQRLKEEEMHAKYSGRTL